MFYSCHVWGWGGRLPKTACPSREACDWCFNFFLFFFFFVLKTYTHTLAHAWEHMHTCTNKWMQTHRCSQVPRWKKMYIILMVKKQRRSLHRRLTAWHVAVGNWIEHRLGIWHHVSLELLINKQHTLCHMLLINKCRCSSHNLLVNHSVCGLDYTRADGSSNQSSVHCNNHYLNDHPNTKAHTQILQTIL